MFEFEGESPPESNPSLVPQSLEVLWVKEPLSKIGSNALSIRI
jgi:hypothetical protein